MIIANPISDLLVRIRNAYAVRRESVDVPYSHFKFAAAQVLADNGYVKNISRKKKIVRRKTYQYIHVILEYNNNMPNVQGLKILSKPSRRLYTKASEIKPVKSGFGMLLVTTPKGVMSGKQAKRQGIGGQVLAEIW